MGLILDSFVLASPEAWLLILPEIVRKFPGAEVFLYSAGAGELLEAALRVSNPEVQTGRLAFAERVLRQIPQISCDELTVRAHARLAAELDQAGRRLHPNTTWPAAHCLAHAWTLVTNRPGLYEGIHGLHIVSV